MALDICPECGSARKDKRMNISDTPSDPFAETYPCEDDWHDRDPRELTPLQDESEGGHRWK